MDRDTLIEKITALDWWGARSRGASKRTAVQIVEMLEKEGLLHSGNETTVEWNVLDNGEPYLQPWTDEDDAREYSNVVTGPLVYRLRTTYEPVVSEWVIA